MTQPRSTKSTLTKDELTELEELKKVIKLNDSQAQRVQELDYKHNILPMLSETCKSELDKMAIEILYNRREDFENKYTKKGKSVEEKSIDLYSLFKGKIFENNKLRQENDLLSGEIDLPWKNKEGQIEAITDIKTAYSIHTFFKNRKTLNKAYYWQGIGYLDLNPTSKSYNVAYCLTNNTDEAILDLLYRESFKWDMDDTPEWRELQIIKQHVFDSESFRDLVAMRVVALTDDRSKKEYDSFVEVPLDKRIIEHTFERDEKVEADITKMRIQSKYWLAYLESEWGIINEEN